MSFGMENCTQLLKRSRWRVAGCRRWAWSRRFRRDREQHVEAGYTQFPRRRSVKRVEAVRHRHRARSNRRDKTMPATAAELREYIAQANGFETHYRHPLSGMSFSEGVKYIADEAGAYWLIDLILIASKFEHLQGKCEGLEFWVLTTKNGQGELTCTDGGIGGGDA